MKRRRGGRREDCGGKVRHATEADALASAARCVGKHGAKRLRVYECTCGAWHLTSRNG